MYILFIGPKLCGPARQKKNPKKEPKKKKKKKKNYRICIETENLHQPEGFFLLLLKRSQPYGTTDPSDDEDKRQDPRPSPITGSDFLQLGPRIVIIRITSRTGIGIRLTRSPGI